MRALAILSISSPVTINELSLYALTEQSTMSRTLDALEEQGFIVPQARAPKICGCATSKSRRPAATPSPRSGRRCTTCCSRCSTGVDNEEYKAFTATLHKMIENIRKHGI